jgi:hypothetical protein
MKGQPPHRVWSISLILYTYNYITTFGWACSVLFKGVVSILILWIHKLESLIFMLGITFRLLMSIWWLAGYRSFRMSLPPLFDIPKNMFLMLPTILLWPDSQLAKILPDGIISLLAQPVLRTPDLANGETKTEGVILLASNANYAYTEKDRVWIRTVANKFQSA